jgi:hypothetical protein
VPENRHRQDTNNGGHDAPMAKAAGIKSMLAINAIQRSEKMTPPKLAPHIKPVLVAVRTQGQKEWGADNRAPNPNSHGN